MDDVFRSAYVDAEHLRIGLALNGNNGGAMNDNEFFRGGLGENILQRLHLRYIAVKSLAALAFKRGYIVPRQNQRPRTAIGGCQPLEDKSIDVAWGKRQ